MIRQRYELPTFGTLLKIARAARAFVNRGYYRQVAAAIPVGEQERLQALLVVPEGASRSAWDQVKTPPLRPSTKHLREYLRHLTWLRSQAVDGIFTDIPDQKIRQFAAEAFTLNASDMLRVTDSKRITLIAALLRRQVAQALDDVADMFVRLIQRIHNRAKKALDDHRKHNAEETDALIASCARRRWRAMTIRIGKHALPPSRESCCPTLRTSCTDATRTRRWRAITTCRSWPASIA